MASIAVPESSHPALKSLVHLSADEFELLLKALNRVTPGGTAEQFSAHAAENAPTIAPSTIKTIVNELFKLTSFKEQLGQTIPDFAKSIADAVLAQQSGSFPFNKTDRDVLSDRLIKLFELKGPLALTAKALDLLTDAQNLFYSSKILTDIRPVFDEKGTAAEAAVMVHHLVIHYRDTSDHKDFFVTLDSNDLKQLRAVLDRAERKAETLKPLLKRLELPYLDIEEQ
jgi:hypothetical protein